MKRKPKCGGCSGCSQRQFVENCESRILTFHIPKVEGTKSQSYQFVAG